MKYYSPYKNIYHVSNLFFGIHKIDTSIFEQLLPNYPELGSLDNFSNSIDEEITKFFRIKSKSASFTTKIESEDEIKTPQLSSTRASTSREQIKEELSQPVKPALLRKYSRKSSSILIPSKIQAHSSSVTKLLEAWEKEVGGSFHGTDVTLMPYTKFSFSPKPERRPKPLDKNAQKEWNLIQKEKSESEDAEAKFFRRLLKDGNIPQQMKKKKKSELIYESNLDDLF